MSKKSHKRAAKYSELSRAKQRKRKQLTRTSLEPTASVTKETREAAATKETVPAKAATTTPAKAAAPKIAPKSQPGGKQAVPDYRYVRDDLKRVGILTGAIIVILIILAFVLG